MVSSRIFEIISCLHCTVKYRKLNLSQNLPDIKTSRRKKTLYFIIWSKVMAILSRVWQMGRYKKGVEWSLPICYMLGFFGDCISRLEIYNPGFQIVPYTKSHE